jgi:hypothetical protein
MWPFKKRANSGRNVPMSPLSTSEAPLDQFDPRIEVAKAFERSNPDDRPGETPGYTGD